MTISVLPRIDIKIHKHNSAFWRALYGGPSAKSGDVDPKRFIKTFLKKKHIRSGVIAELGIRPLLYFDGPNEKPQHICKAIVPELEGFNSIIQSTNVINLIEALKEGVFTEAVSVNLHHLPLSEGILGRESCDVVVWHGAMLSELKRLIPLADNCQYAAKLLFYRTIIGIYEIIKKSGYLIEFYPFDDCIEFQSIFSTMGLRIHGIEYVERHPDSYSGFEGNHILEGIKKDFNNAVMMPISVLTDYVESILKNNPYSIMIIRK